VRGLTAHDAFDSGHSAVSENRHPPRFFRGRPYGQKGFAGVEPLGKSRIPVRREAVTSGNYEVCDLGKLRGSELDEAFLDCEVGQLGIGMKVERLHDLVLVELDGSGRDAQTRCDLFCRTALGQQL
jgi:hypothetical protein